MFATVDVASLAYLVPGAGGVLWKGTKISTFRLHRLRQSFLGKATTAVAVSVAVRRGARYHQKDVALCLPRQLRLSLLKGGSGLGAETHSQQNPVRSQLPLTRCSGK